MASYQNRKAYEPRLVPQVIDDLARDNPDGVYAIIPRSSVVETPQGFRKFTYSELATAINRLCFWMDQILEGYKCFAYIGPNDIRYPLVVAAASKTGRKILLAGHALKLENFCGFLKSFDCKFVLKADPLVLLDDNGIRHTFVDAAIPEASHYVLRKEHSMPVDLWPEYATGNMVGVESALGDQPLGTKKPDSEDGFKQEYPFRKNFKDCLHEVDFVVHTSGTTGPVKPIPYTRGARACADNRERMKENPERYGNLLQSQWPGEKIYCPFSLAHAGGMMMNFFAPLFHGYIAVMQYTRGPPSTETFIEAVNNGVDNVTAAVLPPHMLKKICENDTALQTLSTLKWVWTTTAPLSRAIGDKVAQHVSLQSVWGTSETASSLACRNEDPSDWEYMKFHPDSGIEMVARENGDFEAVQIRNNDLSWSQQAFHIYPDLHAFYTKDLFTPHPDLSKQGLFKFVGRLDDIIVISATPSIHLRTALHEADIKGHCMVKDAIIAGHGRSEPILLIEFADNVRGEICNRYESFFLRLGDEGYFRYIVDNGGSYRLTVEWREIEQRVHESVRDHIWAEIVVVVNMDLEAAGTRISKEAIHFAPLTKPFERTPKGTVNKSKTLKKILGE